MRAAARVGMGDSAASGAAPRISLLDPSSPAKKPWTGGLQYLTGRESKAYNEEGAARGVGSNQGAVTGFGSITRTIESGR